MPIAAPEPAISGKRIRAAFKNWARPDAFADFISSAGGLLAVIVEKIVEKIVSGGQTGVDRAALDTALALGISCGGWCPKGRRAEDGPIPARYKLRETAGADYAERTRLNVRDSDGTLVLVRGAAPGSTGGGTGLTIDIAAELGRPIHIVDLETPETAKNVAATRAWLASAGVRVVNVAGPRESEARGVAAAAASFLADLLRAGIGSNMA